MLARTQFERWRSSEEYFASASNLTTLRRSNYLRNKSPTPLRVVRVRSTWSNPRLSSSSVANSEITSSTQGQYTLHSLCRIESAQNGTIPSCR